MPPKRKASQSIDETPSKYATRSSVLIHTLPPATQRSTASNPNTTPTVRRTYGQKTTRVSGSVSEPYSLKENAGNRSLGMDEEEGGDDGDSTDSDELNLPFPSKSPRVTGAISSGSVWKPKSSIKSAKTLRILDESPTRRQPKRSRIEEQLQGSASDNQAVYASARRQATRRQAASSLSPSKPKRAGDCDVDMEVSVPIKRKAALTLTESQEDIPPPSTRKEIPPSSASITLKSHNQTQKVDEEPDEQLTVPVSPSKPRTQVSRITTSENQPDIEHIPLRTSPRKKLRHSSELVFPLAISIPDASQRTPPASPTIPQQTPTTSPISPSKSGRILPQTSPMRLNSTLPAHLHPCVTAQKRAMLRSLHVSNDLLSCGTANEDVEMTTNDIAYQQLTNLLTGTLSRGEGNSCMVLGPCGSGKTKLVERCLSDINESPIVLRLSGWIQYSDRLAMREIAHQLAQQTGSSFLSNIDDATESFPHQEEEEEANPFLDTPPDTVPVTVPGVSLPPSSHLPALISILPTLARPTVVILDAFDLFALHPRQSLLYCLLDTVQSCRASPSTKGIAVIGVTSRVDTIQLLEKRVKSRFSGRTFRTAAPQQLEDWVKITKTVLSSKCTSGNHDNDDEWQILWQAAVDKFMSAKTLLNALNETFSITRDVRMLKKLITMVVTHISPRSPYPLPTHITDAATLQRARPRFPFLYTLSYPALCLLIASIHADTAGHPVFSFEMLHETFRDQVRTSASAPVQINGGSIGMVRCSRAVLIGAFEALISAKIFVCVAAPTTTVVKEFIKYRCVVERDEVKKTVDKTGQINLKKWLNRAQ